MARRRRASGGAASVNKRGVLTTKTGPRRVRVLRAFDPFTFKTLQAGNPTKASEASSISVSKNVFTQRGHPIVRKRGSVRRLFRKDPYNKLSADAPAPFGTGASVAMFAPEAAQVDTVNANTAFHPEAAGPGPGITVRRQPQPDPIGGASTHGKRFRPNRTTLFGGKTLKRK